MSTLPPEDSQPQGSADEPQLPDQTVSSQPEVPQQPTAPQQPTVPQYEAPPQAQQQQQRYAPPQQPASGAQQPTGGAQQAPSNDPVSTITLNYWLSVFFVWIPALIFYLTEKDKGHQLANVYHRENLNFSLLRVLVMLTGVIPYVGWLVALIGGIALFVLHIMAAAQASEAYRRGEAPPFMFNLPLIK